MREPFFSVIVPAHNAEAFMRLGLDSIRNQSWTDDELIVVCDRCTDDTERIARTYTDKVIVTDFGLDGLARNAGIDAARGKYILFMDHDDWFLHEFVFAQIADTMKRIPDADVLLLSFIWKGVGYIDQRKNRYIAVWCKCWKRVFIGITRFSDRPYWSDVDFDRKAFAKGPRVYAKDIPAIYYNYMMPGSISWRQDQGQIESFAEQEKRGAGK